AVERDGLPILLHTHKTNDAAGYLIGLGAIPGLEGARVVRAEVKVGRSRFDFLLDRAGEEIFLEVKSCTLVGDRVAMFPDAVTERGARHVHELAKMSEEGTRTAVLFLVHWPHADIFMPDFHTDLRFAETLLACHDAVKVIAASAVWDRGLALLPESRALDIPWKTIETEARDRGSYLVLMRLPRTRVLEIGRLGRVRFPRGHYIYVGSAMANLSRRVERHAKVRKRMHWHIDRFRPHALFVDALAIRSSDRLECEIAGAVGALSDWLVPGFGCSDCACPSHLFGFAGDPLTREGFHRLLAWFRMDRLAGR
ncbi:DNA/RNA nuclease SfsA, partial [Thermodesulfobacteriota bacterium]